jgi:hypothetical protein
MSSFQNRSSVKIPPKNERKNRPEKIKAARPRALSMAENVAWTIFLQDVCGEAQRGYREH